MPVATRWPLVGRRAELDGFTSALHDQECQALCIYGPSGVGKTRLGDECLAVAEAVGRRVLRATADRSDTVVPLAAVAHLLPPRALTEWPDGDDGGSVVRARLLDAARLALAAAGGASGPPVLLIDDAHRFDRSSLTVVDHLLANGAVFGVATVNNSEPVPETVTQWWRDERATRIDLGELDPVGVDTLLHVVLEGPLDAAASAELWRASQGNVLILHELVLGALAGGLLVRRDDAWRLDGALDAPDRLGDLIALRIDALAPDGRAVLELLAMCQPVAVGQLESSFGLELLEALERDGLIAARRDGRRQSVSLAHPLHREVLRARVAPERARDILSGHADTLERCGARRRDDPVRIATLRLEATGRADPDLLLRAARVARSDLDLLTAARLARAAVATRSTASGGLILGEALYRLGSFEAAEIALAAAMDETRSETESVAIISTRRRNLFFGCRREDEAAAVGRTVEPGSLSASGRAELLAGAAEVLAYSAAPADALALLEGVGDESGDRALVAGSRSVALAMIGRTADALALSRRAVPEPASSGDPLTASGPVGHVDELFALVQAGRLGEADGSGRSWLDAAVRARLPLDVMWLAVHLARGALAQGRPVTALGWVDRATTAIDAHRYEGLRPIATAVRAAAHGLLGDPVASAAAAAELDGLTAGFGALGVEVPLGRAWALVAAGDLRSARDLLLAGADDAAAKGFVPAAGWLLHDSARLGVADGAVASRLTALASSTDSELVRRRVEHIVALVDSDADRLAAAGEGFAAIGADLLAAEATAQAAEAWRRRGDKQRATVLDACSGRLAEGCEGARSPVLDRAGTVVKLTSREREVAVLAARGLASRAIGVQLAVSVRTVDNHLGRIYVKLGVSSRAELAAALELDRREDDRP